MAAPRKYPEELRERAIRMRLGRPGRPGVRSGGGCPVGAQLGMIADTLRGWVTQAEVDAGGRPGRQHQRREPGRSGSEEQRAASSQRDLRTASAFLAAELDRPCL